jgi:hypothetical protein
MGRKSRLSLVLVTATAVCAALAPSAFGAVRYATPSGGDVTGDCNPDLPAAGGDCTLAFAYSGANNGDEIILRHGTFDLAAGSFNLNKDVDMHGESGFADPVITSSGMNGTVFMGDGKLHDVDVRYGGSVTSFSSFAALEVVGGTAYRLVSSTSSASAHACALAGDLTAPDAMIRDSICYAHGDVSPAGVPSAVALSCACSSFNANLRNVDAIADGVGSIGIFFQSSLNNQAFTINAKNVIAEGVVNDILADGTAAGTGRSVTINIDHSVYDAGVASAAGTNSASLTPVGTNGNLTTAPTDMFVCAPGCGMAPDFHQKAGSPTINAGVTDSLTGTTDFDGNARPQGPAMDIGAYEVPVPPVITPPATNPGNMPGAARKCKKKKKHASVAKKKKCKKRKK